MWSSWTEEMPGNCGVEEGQRKGERRKVERRIRRERRRAYQLKIFLH
jgi:hypothetical protein